MGMLAGPVCVSMCVHVCLRVRRHLLPIPLDQQEPRGPGSETFPRLFWSLRSGSQLWSMGRWDDVSAELNPNLVEAMGQRSGQRDQAVP